MTNIALETEVMAHRYLYYVLSMPVLSDREYDKLESKAIERMPESSPVRLVGSDIAESYTPEQIARAKELLSQ